MSVHQISRRAFASILTAAPFGIGGGSDEWVNLFDGRTLTGWRPSENKASWQVIDGALTADGPRSHLFYTGPVRGADFRNFELEVELITQPDCNSGIYFHTAYQESNFPEKGFEVQVNNTAHGDGEYLERKKTGSLYGLRNMYKQLVPDGKPFWIRIAVRGKNVQIRLNSELLVDYVEPTPPVIPEGGERMRFLDHGTFALQCHNKGSRVAYKTVRVHPLADDLPAYPEAPPTVDSVYRDVVNLGRHNLPMVDYHVLLRPGMTIDDALQRSRKDGIQYGIAAASTAFLADEAAQRWLNSLAGKPVFNALYAPQRGWIQSIQKKTVQRFDYVLADSRIWTDSEHRGVRLWVPEEAKSITNPEKFLDSLLEQTVERLGTEPIDIYSSPTYLPANIRVKTDQLWTERRSRKLIEALAKNQVALEINTREHLPTRVFIEQAKQAGCKFGFGTANETAADLGRCEYGLEMVKDCKLDWHDFFVPGAWWPKAVDRRWPA